MTNLPATNRTLSKSSLAIKLTSGFVALIVLVFVTTCAIIQFWAFPKLEKDPSALQSYLSEKLEGQLSIGKIETFWSFLTPCVRATDINFERAGDIAVTVGLESVTVSGSWISLLTFTPVTSLIDARGLTVDVSRARPAARPPKGALATPRTLLATETDDPVNVVDRAIREIFENPISVHFLNQRHIVVHDSRVSYTDFGLRDPKSVDLFIKTLKTDKYIVAWDMAVDASIVSENIVSPILIDARVKKPFLAHEGRVESYAGVINADFSKIDFAPIARKIALGRWIQQGAGETRVSTTFEAGRITKLSGDIALEDVELHLSRRSLPVELDTLAAHVEQRLDEDALAIEITNLVAQSPLFGVQSIPKIKLSGLWEGDNLRSLGLGIESIDLQCLDFVLDRIPEKEALLKSLQYCAT